MSAERSNLRGVGWILATALALGLGLTLLDARSVREPERVRGPFPQASGRVVLAGLGAPAVLRRDGRGIPHVEAASEEDALRALGFAHAQDRLAQMVWLQRSARGRAAELVGETALEADRLARLLGIGVLADAAVERLPRRTRRALQAYSDGVNARLARIDAGQTAAPQALVSLGAELEPWTPADSVAVLKHYAWALGGHLYESLVLEALIPVVGSREARALFFPRGAGIRPAPFEQTAGLPRSSGDPLRQALGLSGPGVGSSAWVVGGALASGGRPLLAADLHLESRVPSLMYEAHLRAPGLDVAGATLPGLPVFWVGRNPDLAWAAVNPGASPMDLYREYVDGEAPERYSVEGAWRSFAIREEVIRVRGQEPRRLRVRETRHGPLLNPLFPELEEPVALAWASARSGDGIGAFLEIARAASAEALRRALESHHEPVVAVVFADAEGGGGLQLAGWLPRRREPSGLVRVPGRARHFDWAGRIEPDALPAAVLEPDGWVVAADGLLAEPGDTAIEWLWQPAERRQRIQALLAEQTRRGALDLRALAEMQRDRLAPRASDLVRDVLALAGPEEALPSEARQAAQVLRSWDGRVEAGSAGAALYHVFLDRLARELLLPKLGEALFERWLGLARVRPVSALRPLLSAASAGGGLIPGWDEPEPVRRAVRRSLRRAWIWMSVNAGSNREKWVWGRIHRLAFQPLPPRSGGLLGGDRAGDLTFPYGGDGATVAAGAYVASEPFAVRVASLYRFAVDTGEPGHALSSLAPGQSEHPDHPHHADGLRRWRQERSQLLLTSLLLVEEDAASRLQLEPAP